MNENESMMGGGGFLYDEDERAKNVALQGEISNFQQSQYILGQMGCWVAWLGSGSQAAAATGT